MRWLCGKSLPTINELAIANQSVCSQWRRHWGEARWTTEGRIRRPGESVECSPAPVAHVAATLAGSRSEVDLPRDRVLRCPRGLGTHRRTLERRSRQRNPRRLSRVRFAFRRGLEGSCRLDALRPHNAARNLRAETGARLARVL